MGCSLNDGKKIVKITCIKKAAFRVFSKYTFIFANYDLFSPILLGKISNTWATIVSISKNPPLSNIHNQLMTKYTKLRKSRGVYSFSWIFSLKKSQKYWKMAKIPLLRPQILNVFIWSGLKNSLWRVNSFPIKIVVRNPRKLIN